MFNIISVQDKISSPLFWVVMTIGWVGTLIAIFAFLPQSLKTIRTGRTGGVSVVTFFIYTLANSLWFIWGILDLVFNGHGDLVVTLKDSIVIVANIPCALWAGIILGIKIYNMYQYGEDCKKWPGKTNKNTNIKNISKIAKTNLVDQ